MITWLRSILAVGFGITAVSCLLAAYAAAWNRDLWGAAALWGWALGAAIVSIIVVGIPWRSDD